MSSHRLPPKKPPPSDIVAIWHRECMEREKEVTAFNDERITQIRDLAGTLGYAIAVHGSLDRDIDLVAIPWTEDAEDALTLVQELISRLGYAITNMDRKPHCRLAFQLHGHGSKPIDLSVMPLSRGD